MSLSEQQPPFGVRRGLNIADPLANCETRADLKPGPGGLVPAELGQVSAERFTTKRKRSTRRWPRRWRWPMPGSSHLFYHGDWTAVLDVMVGFLREPNCEGALMSLSTQASHP